MPWPGQLKPTNLVGETEAEREVILQAFAKHMIEDLGFVKFFPDVSPPTMRKLCKKYPAFSSKYHDVIRVSNNEISKLVVKKARNPDALVDLPAVDRLVKNRKGWEAEPEKIVPQRLVIEPMAINSREDAEYAVWLKEKVEAETSKENEQ